MNIIKSLSHNKRAYQYPFGRTLQSIYAKCLREHPGTYIWSVIDSRENYKDGRHEEQIGMSIVPSNVNISHNVCISPRLACDGKFGVITTYHRSLDFELNHIVSKEEQPGTIISVMRPIASRKAKMARKHLMRTCRESSAGGWKPRWPHLSLNVWHCLRNLLSRTHWHSVRHFLNIFGRLHFFNTADVCFSVLMYMQSRRFKRSSRYPTKLPSRNVCTIGP